MPEKSCVDFATQVDGGKGSLDIRVDGLVADELEVDN